MNNCCRLTLTYCIISQRKSYFLSGGIMLKDCSFCGSSKIKYSIKTKGDYYQACFYCSDCHAYGPRILTEHMNKEDIGYNMRCKISEDVDIKRKAEEAWNTREMSEMKYLANRLRDIYTHPKYEPTKEQPIKHTMVTYLLANIDAIESQMLNYDH